MHAGTPVTLAVRSENLIFDETCGRVVLQAEVVEKSFAGGLLRVVLKLADGTEVVANRHGIDAGVEPGQKVTCSFAMLKMRCLVDLPDESRKRGGSMKKQKSGSVWMILPLYIFTLIFVAGPLIYMVALSFAQPKAGHGVEWIFTLDNYRKILDPVYMKTFTGSFQLAVTSTTHHLSARLSVWIFYGKAV